MLSFRLLKKRPVRLQSPKQTATTEEEELKVNFLLPPHAQRNHRRRRRKLYCYEGAGDFKVIKTRLVFTGKLFRCSIRFMVLGSSIYVKIRVQR